MAHSDVLIVGAGPTGLVLALWLTRQGVAVRIVDKSSGPGEASRAMAVQARTLELYRQLDLAEAVIDAGYKTPAMNQGKAPDALLDSYQIERQAFARTLVETTDRLFTLVTAQGGFADFVRTRIAPIFASVAYKRESVREYLFRVISQTTLDYRGSPLSQGKAGGVQGGDRLPWLTGGAADNYASLAAIEWQVHVYGQAKADLSQWCAKHGIALHVFAWEQACEKAGFGRNAAYLLRPDSYVALADPEGEASTLSRYFEARGVVLPS
ncbi:FAD-dependent oxidoreductase [Pseudomonas plecoglossicida]|uniref:FAD-dependent oxidoreductase n=1 Tax=Pseudomonas plecoglossicida TaxID=70775 RepID=A0AAD0VQX5_PSEDL|nr:FAD-dependent oxidoreductase [Pseudomonas plecoglossicida]AXM94469.1 FAD-dependent oxidoreductase [Pseudomonas plecoglossicida]QLB55202.1 FAD-dependent oxidoreductase [Pseudomonas plecoglossicida]GLR35158.1 hypothetical protein GCM10011247_05550 [Pseudomonas plecoglossicida]